MTAVNQNGISRICLEKKWSQIQNGFCGYAMSYIGLASGGGNQGKIAVQVQYQTQKRGKGSPPPPSDLDSASDSNLLMTLVLWG